MFVRTLLILLVTGSAVIAEPVTFTLQAHGIEAETLTIQLYGTAPAPDGSEPPVIMKELRRDQPLQVALAPGNWRAEIVAPGVWHAPQFFAVDASRASTVVLTVWPGASLTGRIKHQARAEPEVMSIRFEPADPAAALPRGALQCSIINRTFACSAPAGRYDVRMRARGFIAHHRRDIELPAAGKRDLGLLELIEGQSITGRVELPRGAVQDWSRVQVSATPVGTGGKGMVAANSRVDKKGFFQIDGLPAGAYIVRATAGQNLVSKAVDVMVRTGLEAELTQALRLDRPHRIRLSLAPALDPAGRPWHVRLLTRVTDRHVETAGESNASARGEWEWRGVQPGRYTVVVGTINGDEWYREDLVLESDQHSTISLTRTDLHGSVFLGDRPLQASLKLIGSSGLTVSTRSDEEGRFSVSLPGAAGDTLTVAVSSVVPWIERRLEVALPAQGEMLKVILPDTILQGEVTDPSGRRVPNAIVSIAKGDLREGFPQPSTGQDGTFAAHGLSAGSYTLVASDFLKESEPTTVVIREDETPRPVRLVIRDMSMLRGYVVSAAGPIPGARIHARAVDRPHMITEMRTADASGYFESALPPGTRVFEIVVAPPGFAYIITGGVVGSKPFVVTADQHGGTLRVLADSGHTAYLVHDGGTAPVVAVGNLWPMQSRISDDGSQELTLPMMDPGAYAACIVDSAHDEIFRRTAGQSGGRCVQGFLPPSGSLILDLRARVR
ncbi:MAG TPA: carboxypeptidase-like regulatory domain-containing protein [Woeseiaceae bacterium]|nr:carboxypeptidase-like regulatory domain-containing protein [Woeseiaceae bacterium]